MCWLNAGQRRRRWPALSQHIVNFDHGILFANIALEWESR